MPQQTEMKICSLKKDNTTCDCGEVGEGGIINEDMSWLLFRCGDEIPRQKLREEEGFILTYSCRGRVHGGGEDMVAG